MKLSKELHKLETLFNELNEHFFAGEIITPVITIRDNAKKSFCCTPKNWRNRYGNQFYEMSINPIHLRDSLSEVAETMLHEMVHLFIFQTGTKTYEETQLSAAADE